MPAMIWNPDPRSGADAPKAANTDALSAAHATAPSGGDAEALLRRHGLQVTAQRLAVLQAVTARPHSTADEVCRAVRPELGGISRQAVYDALAVFTERGLVRRIQPGGASARYETRVGDNHHHLVCRVCGRTVDVDCVVGYAPCLTASETRGYEIEEAEVVFRGRCPACVAAAAAAVAAGTAPASPAAAADAGRDRGDEDNEGKKEAGK
jgi:Fur family ferric uptake transcriptional regulator